MAQDLLSNTGIPEAIHRRFREILRNPVTASDEVSSAGTLEEDSDVVNEQSTSEQDTESEDEEHGRELLEVETTEEKTQTLEEAKAARRRAKKRRKRERKKNNNNRPESREGSEEELLDPNSAFVSVAVGKKKRHPATSNIACTNSRRKHVEYDDAVKAESERLAIQGLDSAGQELWHQAVVYFSRAIRLMHSDHRYYSNRSFCFSQLGQYDRALKDANRALVLDPNNPKAHYRRGEALKELQSYQLAEEAFERVVELDETCEYALQELETVRMQQLLDLGFGAEQALAALQQYQSVQAAVNALGGDGRVPDSEWDVDQDTGQQLHKANKMDPSNPEGHLALWVGNVTPEITEKVLIELFSRHGVVLSVKPLPEKFCAFVNFRDRHAPGVAMRHLQGKQVGESKLLIRYPNNPVPESHQQVVLKKPLPSVNQCKVTVTANGNECYFWRTTGCDYGARCRNKHLRDSKGVDRKPWQKPG